MITRKSSKKVLIVMTDGENPDKRHISGKPPGQVLKKRTCPGKPGRMVTLQSLAQASFVYSALGPYIYTSHCIRTGDLLM